MRAARRPHQLPGGRRGQPRRDACPPPTRRGDVVAAPTRRARSIKKPTHGRGAGHHGPDADAGYSLCACRNDDDVHASPGQQHQADLGPGAYNSEAIYPGIRGAI